MAQAIAGSIVELEPNPEFCAGHDLRKINALKQKLVDGIDDGEPPAYTPIGGFAGLI
jgi:hypothetical protein